MKKIIAWVLIFLSASVSGILSSSYVIYFVLEKEKMALSKVFGFELSFDIESTLDVAYKNAIDAENNDIDSILSRSCFFLDSYTESLNPETYKESPERKRELEEFSERVKSKGAELKEAGYCER